MKKHTLDLDSIAVETFAPLAQQPLPSATGTICTHYDTCTNCAADSCIC
jgi:hypothetical protein